MHSRANFCEFAIDFPARPVSTKGKDDVRSNGIAPSFPRAKDSIMRFRSFAFAALVLATLPSVVPAAESAPEALLAKESVAYFRYDGLATHRAAYDKSAFGQLLNTEFKPLVDQISKLIFDALGPQVLSERLLKGVPPAELIRLQKALKQLPRFFTGLKERGFAVGVEVIEPLKGRFQVTIVFPGGPKADAVPVLAAFRLAGHLAESKVRDVKVGARTVLQIPTGEPVTLNCWKEGRHAVLTIGTEPPQRTVELVEGKRPNLTSSPLFQQVAGFKKYETWMRGFADVDAIVQIASKAFPPAKLILSQLGVDGLRNVRFHLGFDGKLQRDTIVVGTRGKRRGLLRLLAPPKTFSLKQLPPLPPNAGSVSAGSADFPAIYDESLRALRIVASVVEPAAAAEFDKALKNFETRTGINLRKDLVESLGSTYVISNAPSEGVFLFGTAVALEVKDAARLKRSLNTLLRSLPTLLGIDLKVTQRKYHGGVLNVVKIGERGFFFTPTYAIHKGWLVVSLYPQPVQGFLYRSSGRPATWKQPPLLAKALRETLRPQGKRGNPRLMGISVSNPKRAVEQVLSLGPLVIGFLQANNVLQNFDLSTIPNSQAVTDHLTDSVAVFVDDGNAVRLEGYSSLPIPSQVTGLDFYVVLPLLQYLRFAF